MRHARSFTASLPRSESEATQAGDPGDDDVLREGGRQQAPDTKGTKTPRVIGAERPREGERASGEIRFNRDYERARGGESEKQLGLASFEGKDELKTKQTINQIFP